MRISDWSSDVCSSDLGVERHHSRPSRRHQWTAQSRWLGAEMDDLPARRLHRARRRRHRYSPRQGKGRARRSQTRAKRSEEHTSELQSLMRISYAVFCLKKKTKNKTHITTQNKETKHPTY